jgi:hypothetical protein
MKKSVARQMEKLHEEMQLLANADNLNRARSITVGTAFGGVTEIMMRGDGKHLWVLLQASEIVELIHQMAANIGCHIHIQPRDDFASWRKWREPSADKPAVLSASNVAAKLDSHKQSELKSAMMARSKENEQTLATQKTVGRKRTKRAAAAA